MVVLIPHQSDMLALSRAQRDILAALNGAAVSFFPHYPLWATFPKNSAADIHDIQKKARSLTIGVPELNGGALSFQAELQFSDGGILHGAIIFGNANGASPSGPVTIPESARSFFPHECRVFRAAEAQFSGCSWSVSESVWVKTAE